MTRASVAEHTHRLRQAGGKRTSVELSAQAVADLEWLRTHGPPRSASEIICAALAHYRNSTRKGSK